MVAPGEVGAVVHQQTEQHASNRHGTWSEGPDHMVSTHGLPAVGEIEGTQVALANAHIQSM